MILCRYSLDPELKLTGKYELPAWAYRAALDPVENTSIELGAKAVLFGHFNIAAALFQIAGAGRDQAGDQQRHLIEQKTLAASHVEHPHARFEAERLDQEPDLLLGALGEGVPQVGVAEVVREVLEPVVALGPGHVGSSRRTTAVWRPSTTVAAGSST